MVRSITSQPKLLLEVERLRRRDLVVDENHVDRLELVLRRARAAPRGLPVPKYAAESNLARFCVNLPTTSNPSVLASWRSSVSRRRTRRR